MNRIFILVLLAFLLPGFVSAQQNPGGRVITRVDTSFVSYVPRLGMGYQRNGLLKPDYAGFGSAAADRFTLLHTLVCIFRESV